MQKEKPKKKPKAKLKIIDLCRANDHCSGSRVLCLFWFSFCHVAGLSAFSSLDANDAKLLSEITDKFNATHARDMLSVQ